MKRQSSHNHIVSLLIALILIAGIALAIIVKKRMNLDLVIALLLILIGVLLLTIIFKITNGSMLVVMFALIMLVLIVGLGFSGIMTFLYETPVENSPEQRSQVKVIGKRIRVNDDNSADSPDTHAYIVAFEFFDGSVKELEVGFGAAYSNKPRVLYDSLQEGDTGLLTYKERENIEDIYENEDSHWLGRQLISFEKGASIELDS